MAEEGGGAPPTASSVEGSGGAEGGVFREAPPSTSNATTGAMAGEDLVQKARGLMRRIVTERASPNSSLLHALAAILEQEEARSGCEPLEFLQGIVLLWTPVRTSLVNLNFGEVLV